MLNLSLFSFAGFNSVLGVAVFTGVGDTQMTIARGADVFQHSEVPVLFYLLRSNLFYASMVNTSISHRVSESPSFLPALLMGFTIAAKISAR